MDNLAPTRLRQLLGFVRALPEEDQETHLGLLAPEVRAALVALLAEKPAGGLLDLDPVPTGGGETVPASGGEGLGTRIGCYKLLQSIGEGGFGSVFMAEQEFPVRRKVALKIIKLGMDTKQVVARFEAERQALAMMDHPNIAKVLDGGATEKGRPYFVMELVKGVPITQYCDTNNLNTRERLALFIPVCHAVQHAHHKGIIHRDIKPSNVLVTMHDGVPVPKVIDFGIAKATQSRLTDKTLFTEYRQLIGTPEYMSPEQAEMSGLDIDTRSDIYSLGVLLYELLTGTTPFDAKTLRDAAFGEIQRMIREIDPPKPSTRVSTLGEALSPTAAHRGTDGKKLGQLMRGELDWIVMKALEKDRTRRYGTANGLAMDVQHFLHDEPVSASPPGHWYVLRKMIRRHKGPFAAVAGVAAALVLGLAVATFGMVQARRGRSDALAAQGKEAGLRLAAEKAQQQTEALRADTERARRQAELALASIYPNNGFRASAAGQDAVASLWFANAARLSGFNTDAGRLNAHRAAAWGRFTTLPVAVVSVPGEWIGELRMHSGNRYLLLSTLKGTRAGEASWSLWDLEREAAVPLPAELGPVTAAAWSPDGRWLAAANAGGDVRILNFPSLDPAQSTHIGGVVQALRFDAEGHRLAIAAGPAAAVWDCVNQAMATPLLVHPAPVASVEFSPAGDRLLSSCQDQQARVFTVSRESAAPLFAPIAHALPPYAGAERPALPLFFDNGAIVLTSSATGLVWSNAADGKVIRRTDIPGGVRCLAALGKRIVVAGPSQARVLDAAGNTEHTIEQRGINCAAFCPDERIIATGAEQNVATWWPMGVTWRNLPDHSARIAAVSYSPDARFAVTAQQGGLVRVWAVPRLPITFSLSVQGAYSGCRISADGKYLIPSGANYAEGSIEQTRVYSATTGEPAGPWMYAGMPVKCAAFSPDSQVALVCNNEQDNAPAQLQLWDWKTGRQKAYVPLTGFPESLSYSADGKSIAVVCNGADSVLVDASTAAVRRRWQSPNVIPVGELLDYATCFSPDSQTLITFDRESLVVREVAGGEPRYPALRCGAAWTHAAFSPDGRYFATTSADMELRVWETSRGRQVSPPMHSEVHAGAQFSADGKLLLTQQATMSVWDWREARLLFPPVQRITAAKWGAGEAIIAVDNLGTLTEYEGRTGAPVETFGPLSTTGLLSVSPDGRLISVGADATVRVVDQKELRGAVNTSSDPCLWGELISCQQIAGDGAVMPLTTEQWTQRWRTYRASDPGPSPLVRMSDQAIAFHRQKAADSRNGDAACVFHLTRLVDAGAARPAERILLAYLLAKREEFDKATAVFTSAARQFGYDADALQDYANLLPLLEDPGHDAEFQKALSANNQHPALVRGNWWTVGPFPMAESQQRVGPSELDARKSMIASSGPGHQEVRWRMADQRGPAIDLGQLYNRANEITVFAQQRIYSADDASVVLGITLDDGGQLWLNDQKIYDLQLGWNQFYTTRAKFRKGWNTLLARVPNQAGAHMAKVQVLDDPLVLGRYYLEHPAEGLDNALPYLNQAVERRASDAAARFTRSEVLARLGRFKEALADLDKGLEIDPNPEWNWMQDALLHLYLGEPEEYRKRRKVQESRFFDSPNPFDIEHVCRLLAVDSELDPILDSETLAHADTIVHRPRVLGTPEPSGWFLMAQGVIEYRRGEFQRALETLQRARERVDIPASRVTALLYMAMAQHRLSHPKEARALFAEASRMIEADVPKAGSADLSQVYHEWVICQITLKEAEAVVAGRNQKDWAVLRKRRRDAELVELTAQIQANATSSSYYIRGLVFARGGQFREALADMRKAHELKPAEHLPAYIGACLLAFLDTNPGDHEAFLTNRRATLEQFGDTRDRNTAERISKAALLMPIDAEALKTAKAMSDVSLAPGGGEEAEVWFPLAQGMAEYRLGESDPTHYTLALNWLTRAKLKNRNPSFLATVDFYLAMAHQRLGHLKEARAFLNAAQHRVHTEVPKVSVDDLQEQNVENWLICQVARREAESLIESVVQPPAAPDAQPAK